MIGDDHEGGAYRVNHYAECFLFVHFEPGEVEIIDSQRIFCAVSSGI